MRLNDYIKAVLDYTEPSKEVFFDIYVDGTMTVRDDKYGGNIKFSIKRKKTK